MALFDLFRKKPKPTAQTRTQPPKLRDKTKNYTYSFSGADATCFVWFPGMEERVEQLKSVHTISVSVHEAKGQARALGHRGIKGLSRGVRTIAGSLIMTIIEDNPLRPLLNNLPYYSELRSWPGWSIDRDEIGTGTAIGGSLRFDNRIAPLIPPFHLYMRYVSEGSLYAQKEGNPTLADIAGAGSLLKNVEFLDEGTVTSVNDIVSEVTLSFIATDYKPISRQEFTGIHSLGLQHRNEEIERKVQERIQGRNILANRPRVRL